MVADAPVLCPTPHQHEKLLGAHVDLATLCQQSCAVKWGHGVDRQVDGHGFAKNAKLGRSQQRHFRLIPSERRSPELEATSGHQLVRAHTNCGLLQLPSVQVCVSRRFAFGPVCQALGQGGGVDVDDDVDVGHRHAEGLAPRQVAAGEAEYLCFRHGAGQKVLDCLCKAIDDPVALGRRHDLGQELLCLRLQADALKRRGCHRGRAGRLRSDRPDLHHWGRRSPLLLNRMPARLRSTVAGWQVSTCELAVSCRLPANWQVFWRCLILLRALWTLVLLGGALQNPPDVVGTGSQNGKYQLREVHRDQNAKGSYRDANESIGVLSCCSREGLNSGCEEGHF
mmetsp:Transcript_70795/g.114111  ORF Transcript_70795/g.114111 Transcript_70795/m.114111 type:complete len:339 (+) Transcript_70795:684-1700(+)